MIFLFLKILNAIKNKQSVYIIFYVIYSKLIYQKRLSK